MDKMIARKRAFRNEMNDDFSKRKKKKNSLKRKKNRGIKQQMNTWED